jgi:Rrf2 family transcriptional regulator, cysteine metabolism repressor
MRISQKIEYACRAMAQLAKRRGSPQLTRLDDLAQTEVVSANFLVQILADLRHAGLVVSRRGKDGGYELAKEPSAITLSEIIEAIDPGMFDFVMSREGESGPTVAKVWMEVGKNMQSELNKVTVEDMMQLQAGVMFYI